VSNKPAIRVITGLTDFSGYAFAQASSNARSTSASASPRTYDSSAVLKGCMIAGMSNVPRGKQAEVGRLLLAVERTQHVWTFEADGAPASDDHRDRNGV
jgi:hypothetical protein